MKSHDVELIELTSSKDKLVADNREFLGDFQQYKYIYKSKQIIKKYCGYIEGNLMITGGNYKIVNLLKGRVC